LTQYNGIYKEKPMENYHRSRIIVKVSAFYSSGLCHLFLSLGCHST